jgi:uncharacterized protein
MNTGVSRSKNNPQSAIHNRKSKGEGAYKEQESGEIVPSFERSEAFDQEPRQEPAQDTAEGKFKEAEMRQVEATARTIGIPSLRAKQNVEVTGVGRKFSGVYYCHSVRHHIGKRGYSCELKLKKNALGKGAGEKAGDTEGTANEQEAQPNAAAGLPIADMVTVDAESGANGAALPQTKEVPDKT